ncbi:TauD/TfdA dioxygenase family protein [Sphingomonas tabacisoli]|uniref:TauD/TfdA dioxygenase family protein n=1 Tax=Sphingomonas tabacisoli TaxID=2249466 RepID=A0ABW4I251_9SPHN
MKMDIEPIKPAIGARIHVDRADFTRPELAEQCAELLEKRQVLVFPRLNASDEEQLAFTDSLGGRINLTGESAGDSPDVYNVTLDPKLNKFPATVLSTFFYHMDGLVGKRDMTPPKATVLSGRVVPAEGGDTEFASTYAAYEHLPQSEKDAFEELQVEHSMYAGCRNFLDQLPQEHVEMIKGLPVNTHPLVWKHDSGRKSLVIGLTADKVVGMEPAEGRALLARLTEWAGQPDFSYKHTWEVGDLVIWDNPGTLHRARPYDKSSGRSMHRTSVAGHEMVK